MKARLAMMGLQADIRQVQVGGQTFHRVYLGPFENEAQADRWAERLRRENIEVLRLPVSG
jgi:cell division protein FtsN